MGSTELPFTFVNTEEDILELQISVRVLSLLLKKYAAALSDHHFVRICYIMQLRIICSLYVYEHTS